MSQASRRKDADGEASFRVQGLVMVGASLTWLACISCATASQRGASDEAFCRDGELHWQITFLQVAAHIDEEVQGVEPIFANSSLASNRSSLPLQTWREALQDLSLHAVNEKFSGINTNVGPPLLPTITEDLCKVLVLGTFACFFVLFICLLACGLPRKAPQHPSVKGGCSMSWVVFMGMVFTFTYFTTDQYVPSLPQMGVELSGSQALMSATVQLNFIVKAVSGIFTASLSDRIGRRPTLVMCLFLLTLASFCCGCAGRVEWFVAARVLQGVGESCEPVIFAMTRDFFSKPEDRFSDGQWCPCSLSLGGRFLHKLL